jgi:hypothetical protein
MNEGERKVKSAIKYYQNFINSFHYKGNVLEESLQVVCGVLGFHGT